MAVSTRRTLAELARARLDQRRASQRTGPQLRLKEFVVGAWTIVEPRDLVWERHMTEVALHLEAILWTQRPELKPEGWDEEIREHLRELGIPTADDATFNMNQLIINVPPGSSKSLLVCVFFMAWAWSLDSSLKFLYATYDSRLSRRDAVKARRIIESQWFISRWGELESEDQWSATFYINRQGGFRFSTTVAGGATGNHADIQIVDDPVKPLEIAHAPPDATKLEEVRDWWQNTMPSRMVDAATSARIIIMQRLHKYDLAGICERSGEYEVLKLPMEFRTESVCRTKLGGDWRTEEDELLAPGRFSKLAVERLKRGMASRAIIAAQLQQEPVPEGGGIFKRAWFKRLWTELPRRTVLIQSWDMRFKEDPSSGDFVVGQVWGRHLSDFYLVDEVRGRWSFDESCAELVKLSNKWPRARRKLVEDKANGPAVVNHLRKKLAGLVLLNPEGGKVARANASAPVFESGNVWLPSEDAIGPDGQPIYFSREDYIEEFEDFPKGLRDDRVDATTQAVNSMYESNTDLLKKAMAAVAGNQ